MFSRKSRKDIYNNLKKTPPKHHIAIGMVVLIFAALLFAAFMDYRPQQTRFVSTQTYDNLGDRNIFGEFGANFVFFAMRYFGASAWLIPLIVAMISFMLFWPSVRPMNKRRILAISLMLISAAGLCDYVQKCWLTTDQFLKFSENKFSAGLGGIAGWHIFSGCFEKFFGNIGSAFILATLFFMSCLYVCTRCTTLNGALEKKLKQLWRIHVILFRIIRCIFLSLRKIIFFLLKKIKHLLLKIFGIFTKKKITESTPIAPLKEKLPLFQHNDKPDDRQKIVDSKQELVVKQPVQLTEHSQQRPTQLPSSKGKYILPPIDILQKSKISQNVDDHLAVSKQLVDTLAEFGISVKAGEVHIGPVITRYEILPAPGVRVEKIANLDKNIALNLRAQSVRILAPVPGRGCVGIELPNKNPQMVCLREILESDEWANMQADIPVVLGRGTTGEPMINDLSKMPHLLIAGSTGSGKTVCINAIIASLVYHSTPDDLRFIMVDPKIVEMQIFNKLPHMLIPVVTDPKKVPNALKWLISEMESRYKIFAKAGVRNIAGFNAKILRDSEESKRAKEMEKELSPEERSAINSASEDGDHGVDVPKKKIPYIVCIIDELADLMMVAPADIETCVARLAQLARAAGIHLILATQRPSVNVITGIIKANLPSRIAFKVASKVDSRTILDVGGADSLLGRGDMLFQPPGASGLLRAQGALVSDDEITGIVEFLHKNNGDPEYAMDVHAIVESGDDGEEFSGEEWDDDMIPKAIEVLRSSDRASTSLLQRRLKIGYNRAARIMDTLVERGLVPNGQPSQDID